MRIMCIHGHEGILEEGEIYHVSDITEKGHYLLFEVDPPHPFKCFNKDRFVPLTDIPQEELVEDKEFWG